LTENMFNTDSKSDDLMNDSVWEETIGYFFLGKCHTLRLTDGSIGFSLDTALKISFNSSLGYYVMLIDPNFYLMTSNPRTIPRILLSLKKNSGEKFLYLDVVEHINLNRKDNPCQASSEYSFTNCIKTRCAEKIGCRKKWDKTLKSDLPVCTTREQILRHSKEYETFKDKKQMELVKLFCVFSFLMAWDMFTDMFLKAWDIFQKN
jgi:hypothetical protein